MQRKILGSVEGFRFSEQYLKVSFSPLKIITYHKQALFK